MRKITGAAFLSLDGVMQAPGGSDEDRAEGFEHGGWMWAFGDKTTDKALDDLLLGAPYDLLLGRKTYDIFASFWPKAPETIPITGRFNQCAKYVMSRGSGPLSWNNSHRLRDIDAVKKLKGSAGPDLLIQGSSTLYPQLLSAGLLDRLVLQIFPVVLGSGKRLFGDGTPPRSLRLMKSVVGEKGAMIATYETAGPVVIATPDHIA